MNTKDGIRLTGTLTMPDKPIAGAILISGSGPQDRDQLFLGHKTFLVLADYLTRNGIAVLRYDDRGVGQSQGTFAGATSYDFAKDASAAVDFLKKLPELYGLNIGAIGHSEGGLIAPVLAKQNNEVDFVVLMAGPSRTGQFVSENQMKKILLSNGVSLETAVAGSEITASLNKAVMESYAVPIEQLKLKLTNVYQQKWQQLSPDAQTQLRGLGGGSLTDARIQMLVGDWYKTFLTHDPVKYITEVKVPILALYGDKDVQVDAVEHAKLMATAIKSAGNSDSKVKVLPDHNHLFQMSKTGAMTEYQHIEETLSQTTLTSIAQWILKLSQQTVKASL